MIQQKKVKAALERLQKLKSPIRIFRKNMRKNQKEMSTRIYRRIQLNKTEPEDSRKYAGKNSEVINLLKAK